MKFTKMHGIGNDYIYVNCLEETVESPSELARKVSDRHFGIGGDGLILIKSSHVADFKMEMYNADGSRGEMCGNGIRCVGKYVYDKGLTDRTRIFVETLGGIKQLDLTVKEGKAVLIRVDMGSPEFLPKTIPVHMDGETAVNVPLTAGQKEYRVTGVSTGNPHCVTFLKEDIGRLDLKAIGPLFEHHAAFPNRINTEFVNVIDRKTLRMRVWERGSGETLACGTGACAVAAAAVVNGICDEEVLVQLLGGDLKISWDRKENRMYMTGEAEEVFEGEIFLGR